MGGIPARVDEASVKLTQNDGENAMIQVSIAIDATSKKKFSKRWSNSKRNKTFLNEHEDFIIYSAFYFQSHLYVDGDLTIEGFGKISNIIYKFVRCNLLHEGDADNFIKFLDQNDPNKFGSENGRFMISHSLIMGLILLIIGDPVNKNLSFKRPWMTKINEKTLDLNSMWGKLPVIKKIIGFEDMPPDFFDKIREQKAKEAMA